MHELVVLHHLKRAQQLRVSFSKERSPVTTWSGGYEQMSSQVGEK
jgi:hypothetical protein